MVSRVSLEAQASLRPVLSGTRTAEPKGASFASLLTQAMGTSESVRVSAHAAQRLEARGVRLSADSLAQVGEALDQLAEKGGKEALVLLGDVALVASVPNRTIITAVASGDDQTSIFTQIDSAAVLSRSEAAESPIQPTKRADAVLNSAHGLDPLREARALRIDRRSA